MSECIQEHGLQALPWEFQGEIGRGIKEKQLYSGIANKSRNVK